MVEDPELAPGSDARTTSSDASWVEEVTGELVERSTPLVGGMSSEVVKHELSNGRTVVSRHITNSDWLEREPHLIDAEASALRLLATSEVCAPAFIASDPTSGRLAMSFLDGEMVVDADDLQQRVGGIARVAIRISRVELPLRHGLPTWQSWAAPTLEPPPWGDVDLWTSAIAAFQRCKQPPAERPVLLHRDLHPLNLLWTDNRPNVVDWVNACTGHPHAELGHCRWNLAVLCGLDCADAFLDLYLSETDHGPYDWFWDLAPVMSFLPGPLGFEGWQATGRTDLTAEIVIERTEAFLRAVLVDKTIDTSNDHLDD